MDVLKAAAVLLLAATVFVVLFWTAVLAYRKLRGPDQLAADVYGKTVEVDCRHCQRINRVPCERLRDRPRCGACKLALMPRRRVRIVEATMLTGQISTDLDYLWNDERRFWSRLADYVETGDKKLPSVKSDVGRSTSELML